ncbi:unnamed protein product [Allacma fusca]|uniref:G-protein coupled receptors family 1 profile domain-containing protein n=1 Tax=Allacma fusca TaxID=39272 RepID=A0A8J2KRE1_9HEXA|nr:unnamed protein product [Allacma fusca]
MAIVRPLQPRMTKKAAWRAIAAIWVCSAVLALPNLLYSTTETFENGSTQCFLHWPDGKPDVSNLDFGYNICLIIFAYFIPMIAMAVCYGSMSKELWGHRQIGEVTERQINSMISKRKVVRMFIVIVFLFAICWAPYHLYFIYASYDINITYKKWVRSLYLSFYFLAMSTSMVNPIIYYLMNTRFRNYIQEIVSNFFFCRRRRSSRRRDFIGETPPLFRRYSQSYSRSRSGTGDENVQNSPHPKAHCNLVLQSHLHYYHQPTVNHAQQTMGTRHQMKRLKSPHGTGLHRKTLKTGSTYC